MTITMTTSALEKLIWVLIYGGLLLLVIGLAVQSVDPSVGGVMSFIGILIALLGFVCIYIRSRMNSTDNKKD
jgi:vacuolar-type H+-ATPase subunit I/STV1